MKMSDNCHSNYTEYDSKTEASINVSERSQALKFVGVPDSRAVLRAGNNTDDQSSLQIETLVSDITVEMLI